MHLTGVHGGVWIAWKLADEPIVETKGLRQGGTNGRSHDSSVR